MSDTAVIRVRDGDKGNVYEMTMGEMRDKYFSGELSQECEVIWGAEGPWCHVKDYVPDEAHQERTVEALNHATPQELLQHAAASGDYEMVRWLLHGVPETRTTHMSALTLAIRGGHAECVRALVARGTERITMEMIDAAAECGTPIIHQYLNPTDDAELKVLYSSAAATARKLRAEDARVQELNDERARLERQLAGMPAVSTTSGLKPKCITCRSEDLEKITLSSKGVAAVLFGFLSIGHASKTFRCRNCGYTW